MAAVVLYDAVNGAQQFRGGFGCAENVGRDIIQSILSVTFLTVADTSFAAVRMSSITAPTSSFMTLLAESKARSAEVRVPFAVSIAPVIEPKVLLAFRNVSEIVARAMSASPDKSVQVFGQSCRSFD